MDKNKDNIAVSALYTAATWRWAGFPCAEFVTPENARPVFQLVNAFMLFYRLLNPRKFSLRHQLTHRHAAIDHLLSKAGNPRVVEVAAGFSARGSRVSADPSITYVEVDLPDMVRVKRTQLESTASGRAVLGRSNFQLRDGDVTNLDFAWEFGGTPVTVISEGLMMYFPRDMQLMIWSRMADLLRHSGGVYLFDYIPLSDEPERSLPGKLLHWLRKSVFSLHDDFSYDGRNRVQVAEDLHCAGFDEVDIVSTGDVAKHWALPQARVPSRTIIYACRCQPMMGGGEK
jgi:O-methyltransferase involved in polyketide biosynthesis